MSMELRSGKVMAFTKLYEGSGFFLSSRSGNTGDHVDLMFPEGGLAAADMPTVVLMARGSCTNYAESDPTYENLFDKDHPHGEGKKRPGGLNRVFCNEDNTVRLCLRLWGPDKMDTDGDLDWVPVVGQAGPVHVPQGGIFILTIGTIQLGEITASGVTVIEAASGDLNFNVDAGVYGLAAWRV